MSNLVDILQETADPNPSNLAKILNLSVEEVEKELSKLQADGDLIGWVPLVHPSKKDNNEVRAVIEVKISPERDGGFDRLASRIAKFEEVEACHLMSGAYDLMVIVKGRNLHAVASLFPSDYLQWMGCYQQLLIFYSVPTKSMDIYYSKRAKIWRNPPLVHNIK